MDKTVTISKPVDLGMLTTEMKSKSAKVTGLGLNAETDLIVYGADDLSDADILSVVNAHVKPIKVSPRVKFKADVDSSPITPELKLLLKRLADLKD